MIRNDRLPRGNADDRLFLACCAWIASTAAVNKTENRDFFYRILLNCGSGFVVSGGWLIGLDDGDVRKNIQPFSIGPRTRKLQYS
jgi:hypothetical protein